MYNFVPYIIPQNSEDILQTSALFFALSDRTKIHHWFIFTCVFRGHPLLLLFRSHLHRLSKETICLYLATISHLTTLEFTIYWTLLATGFRKYVTGNLETISVQVFYQQRRLCPQCQACSILNWFLLMYTYSWFWSFTAEWSKVQNSVTFDINQDPLITMLYLLRLSNVIVDRNLLGFQCLSSLA